MTVTHSSMVDCRQSLWHPVAYSSSELVCDVCIVSVCVCVCVRACVCEAKGTIDCLSMDTYILSLEKVLCLHTEM